MISNVLRRQVAIRQQQRGCLLINNASLVRRCPPSFSTQPAREVEGESLAGRGGPIGDDGRHEVWRENQSSDHDNEPRYVNKKMLYIYI